MRFDFLFFWTLVPLCDGAGVPVEGAWELVAPAWYIYDKANSSGMVFRLYMHILFEGDVVQLNI